MQIEKIISKNQTVFEVKDFKVKDFEVLFSYITPVAAKINGIFYRTNQSFSATTTKHINKWLNGNCAEKADQAFFETLVEENKLNGSFETLVEENK